MANEVEINVTGRNTSGQAIRGARADADELGNSTKRVGTIAAGVVASGVFERIASSAARAFTDTIRAASDLEQAVGGTEAVFGDASGAIDRFAESADQSTGLSERAFREMTTLVGGQLKRMTGDIDFASESSIQLAEVGADLAATYGGTTKEAMDAFAAALRGEADPAERFNLNLKASVVNAKAVELGLASTTDQVDEAAKAQALMALITEQSADAQGQFARESDTAAVAGQKLTAAVENAQASVGEALLPVLAAGAEVLSNVVAGFQELPGPVQAAIAVLAGLAAVAGTTAVAVRALGVSLSTALGPIGIALAAGGAVIAGLGLLGSASREAAGGQEELRATLDETTGAVTRQTREFVANRIVQEGIAEDARNLGIDLATLTEAYLGNEQAIRAVRNRTREVIDDGTTLQTSGNLTREVLTEEAEAARGLNEDLDSQVQVLRESEQGQRDVAAAIGETGASEEELREQLEETTSKVNEQKSAIEELISKMFEASEGALGLSDAEIKYAETLDNTTEAIAQNGEGLDVNTEKGRKNQAALNDLARDGRQLIETLVEEGASARDAGERMEDLRRDFIRAATATGLTAKEARQLADDYGLIPRRVRTDVDEVGNARERLDDLLAQQRAIERQINVNVNVSTSGSPLPPSMMGVLTRAAGGPVGAGPPIGHAQAGGSRGSDVLLGEGGPEIVELPFGSRVIPAGETRSRLGAIEELLEAVQRGRGVFEDLSFRGMSENLGRFNDEFARQFSRSGGRTTQDLERFLQAALSEAQRRIEREETLRAAAQMMARQQVEQQRMLEDRLSNMTVRVQLEFVPGVESAFVEFMEQAFRVRGIQIGATS